MTYKLECLSKGRCPCSNSLRFLLFEESVRYRQVVRGIHVFSSEFTDRSLSISIYM